MKEDAFKKKLDNFYHEIRNIPLPVIRTVLKASIAVLISMVLVLVDKTRSAMGPACTLTTLATLLYCPVKPMGIQTKRTIQGILSAAIGTAWCYLGNYAANAVRDSNNPSPMQVSSSVLSGAFCGIMMFVCRYVRAKYPQLDFATTFASMIGSFALTTNVTAAGFQPNITFNYVKPILFASAIALAVNILLWPTDSVSQYIDTMATTLKEFNVFFQRNAGYFLEKDIITDNNDESTLSNYESNTSLASLKGQLQKIFIKLIDAQHDIDYSVLHHQLSHNHISKMTGMIKTMHTPLHGIGVGNICKLKEHIVCQEKEVDNIQKNENVEFEKLTLEMVFACKDIVDDCIVHSSKFKDPPRSIWSTLLWPFPRLYKRSLPKLQPISLEAFDDLIKRYKDSMRYHVTDVSQITKIIENGGEEERRYQLLNLFRFNIVGYANSVKSFASYINELNDLNKKKFWLPQVSLQSWFKPSASNSATMIGGQIPENHSIAESIRSGDSNSFEKSVKDSELGLSSYDNQINSDENNVVCAMNRNYKPCPRDPDVDVPVTGSERFFNVIGKFINWLYSPETIFGLKTAIVFMLLSLPAYLPQSVGWFGGWGGQWVANTLIMWMFPMAGMFNFTILLGLLGSVIGAVLSIITYEIVRGNAYGIAVFTFIVMVVCFYIFFTKPMWSFLAVMIQYTYLMVMTFGYQIKVGAAPIDDIIEVTAGKRLIFVILGIVASVMTNWLPRPVTGRVQLRKNISKTFRDLSTLYGAIFANILMDDVNTNNSQLQSKKFKQLQLSVQRQLSVETTFLNLSKFEPPLKGKFPFDTYKELILRLNNMADLIEGMAYSASALDKSWRSRLLQVLNEERFDYIACILTVMRSLSANLSAKMPMPPYMISPQDLKDKVDEKLCNLIHKNPEQICNESLPSYCAYFIASSRFTEELILASECVENLVGVDNPERWLLSR